MAGGEEVRSAHASLVRHGRLCHYYAQVSSNPICLKAECMFWEDEDCLIIASLKAYLEGPWVVRCLRRVGMGAGRGLRNVARRAAEPFAALWRFATRRESV
jgi:hypothetical protein